MGDSKEIKLTLKDARQYIKDKEYKAALKEVKKVLNKDKNHYMALVFCGVCLAELEQPDQAIQAYKRATESSPDQEIAWEGLCKFYDKHPENKDYASHHISSLQALIKLVQNDEAKCYDLASKLSQLQLNSLDLAAAIHTLSSQVDVMSDETLQKSLHEKIVKIFSQQTSIPSDLQPIYRKSLEGLLHGSATIENMENMKHIIKLLHQMRDLRDCYEKCVLMTTIFTQNIFPLEYICRIYLEYSCCLKGVDVTEESKNPEEFINRLIEFSNKNLLGNLARGQYLIETGEIEQGINLLVEYCKSIPPDAHGTYLLASGQYQAGQFAAAELTVTRTLKVLKQVKEDNLRRHMRKELNIINLKSLYHQRSLQALESQLTNMEALLTEDNCSDQELNLLVGKVYATLDKHDKLADFLSKTACLESADVALINAIHMNTQSKTDVAEKLLEQSLSENPNCGEALVLMGVIIWNKDDKQKSLSYFLKAAKVDSRNWLPFLYLGHYYRSIGAPEATDKARKCYQKCLALNPQDADAGKGLSDIYRETGLLQENLDFLTSVTKKSLASSGKSTWAWLRLGVHYLATDQPTLAVSALQSALRGDSSDINCWEALAEAYMARGSFTAAQKSFEKVLQLDSNSVYARLQIAAIKDRLGKWREGSADYRQLLAEVDDNYLPGLRGLGESLLNQAKAYLQSFIDKNVVDCIEEALCVLTKAAELNPSMIGTWRLIGDCCAVIGELPEACVDMMVPCKLVGEGGKDEEKVSVGKEQILELGSRAYVRALNLDGENWQLWHQLAVIYILLAKLKKSREIYYRALSVLKHTVKLVPGNQAVWNSLGLAAMQVSDWNLAQHSFIKSLQIEASSSTWTHLGILYLHRGDLNLANRALKEAQSCEPSNLRGWAGQALVAEAAGFPSESMDLFRHCTFLGGEVESARGYANWALSTIRDMDKGEKVESHNRYIIEKMFGLAAAADSLTLYCRRINNDALAFCQLSITLERQGLLHRALEFAEKSRNILSEQDNQQLFDKVTGNIARLQCRLGDYAASVATYQSMKAPTLESTVGLALAQYMLANYQESYEVYKSCLHWMAESQAVKSDILVAMGNLAYKVEGPEVAKTLLFQSCQITPPSVRGILALCVLGIQSSDLGLIDAALAEMSKHGQDPRYAHDIVYLQASVLLLKGDLKGAHRLLLRSVHQMPWSAPHWRDLAIFLLFNCKDQAAEAATCARKAGLLAQSQTGFKSSGRYISKVKGLKDTGSDMFLAESMVIESLSLLLSGDRFGCKRVASKLCHLYPYLPHAWTILSITGESCASWKPKIINHVLNSQDENIRNWAATIPS